MADQSIEQLIEQYAADDSETGGDFGEQYEEDSLEGMFDQREELFEWIIPPDQFVDFWVASVFLLVGTWQVITMFFLLVGE